MARFTAMQASRLHTAEQLHQVRETLHALRTELVLGGAEVHEIDDLEARVTNLLSKLIPNAPIAQ